MKEYTVVKALSALAQVHRLRIFRAFVVAGQAGLTPGTISAGLGLPAATLSFHLKELMNAGLVTQERRGRNLIYRADYGRMNKVLGYLTENCCEGGQCLEPPATRRVGERSPAAGPSISADPNSR